MIEFEETIKELGSFGRYQVRLFLLVSLFETPAAWYMLLPIFTGATPKWVCLDTLPGNTSLNESQTTLTSECSRNCHNISFTQKYSSIVGEWNLVCERDYVSDFITSLQMAGVLLGALVTGQLADTFGRRNVFYVVYALLCISVFATSFAPSWPVYAVLRFFAGAFLGGTLVINFVLPLEFVTKSWRIFCGCVGFWAVGVMTLSPLAYFLPNWRHLTLVTSLAGLPILLSYWFVAESPRWLLQKGRYQEAEDILRNIAKFNNAPEPSFTRLRQAIMIENADRHAVKRVSYWDLCRSGRMTGHTLILLYAWFVSSCVYYGTSLNLKHLGGNRYMNVFFSGLAEVPALVVVILVSTRVGRRQTLCGLMLLAAASSLSILIVDLSGSREDHPALVITLAMIGRSGIAGGWAATGVFSAEMFPTVVRNIGVGSCSMAARIGGIVAPQFVYLNMVNPGLPYAVFGGVALLCSLLALCLPETLRKPLPDTLPPWSWACCRGNRTDLEMEDLQGYTVVTSSGQETVLQQTNGEVKVSLLENGGHRASV